MPIQELTDAPRSYIKLGQIRKGIKNEDGSMKDLDYFRVTFMAHPKREQIEKVFREVYGEKPHSLNVKFAFPTVREVFDANYECYKQGGLYWKAGSTAERGLYWIFYRDADTAEVLISNGMPRTNEGADLLSKPIDLNESLYDTLDKKRHKVPHYLSPVGRLEVVIEELAGIAVGYFEFRPESPRDIRNLSVELGTYEFMASQFGKSLLGIPFKLFRREETVSKKIGNKLSQGPSWVIHIEASAEWNQKALGLIQSMALPEIIEGETVEMLGPGDLGSVVSDHVKASDPQPVVVDTPKVIDNDPLVELRGMWCVDYYRSTFNCTAQEAVQALVEKFGKVSKVKKSEFLAFAVKDGNNAQTND